MIAINVGYTWKNFDDARYAEIQVNFWGEFEC